MERVDNIDRRNEREQAMRIMRSPRAWMAGVLAISALVLLGCDGERMDLLFFLYKIAGAVIALAAYQAIKPYLL